MEKERLKGTVLENSFLRVEVLPERGGKILSLKSQGGREEWLWQPDSPDPLSSARAVFDEREAFGFDEMFPTIVPEEQTGPEGQAVFLPDHGEIWSRPWEILRQDREHLDLGVSGTLLPYRFTRRLFLRDNSLHMGYTIVNKAPSFIPALWTPHPLFSFYEESEILIPGDLKSIRQAMDGGPLGEYGRVHSLGRRGDVEGAGALFLPGSLEEGSAYKFYGDRILEEGWCGLKDRRGTLKMSYPSDRIPWLGFWINKNGWGGQQNLALEPATAPMDCPGGAEKFGVRAGLEGGETLEWEMVIHIE